MFLKVSTLFFILNILLCCSCNKENNLIPEQNYTLFNTQNTGLSFHFVTNIEVDKYDNVRFGTVSTGLIKFDGTNWSHYNRINSPLPNDSITALYINSNGRVFIGTTCGLDQNGGLWVGALSNLDNS